MIQYTDEQGAELLARAAAGDREALTDVVTGVQDMVFNLSLRMLGTFSDAQDATQEILMKVIAGLPAFRRESALETWVFRIAVHHLIDYKKHMFAQRPLSFEYYGYDIVNGSSGDVPDLTQNVEKELLSEELKMSCTNVMLQCLDPESRCIFILGTMFRVDSRVAGEVLGMSPEAYRQRLSRTRKKMAEFLTEYCGEYGSGKCRCRERINYAIQNHRISPGRLEYTAAAEADPKTIGSVREAMEQIDDLSQRFAFLKEYRSPERIRRFVREFLDSELADTVIHPSGSDNA